MVLSCYEYYCSIWHMYVWKSCKAPSLKECDEWGMWIYHEKWCLGCVPKPRTSLWLLLNGFTKSNMELMGVLKNIRPSSLLEASLKRKELTITRYLHRLPDIPLSDPLLLSLPLKGGAYTKWMLRLLSCMARLRKKSTWNNLMGSKYKIEGHTYASWRKSSKGWNKPLGLGMRGFIAILWRWDLQGAMYILTYPSRLKRTCLSFWSFMWMISFWQVQTLSFINVRGSWLSSSKWRT